MNDTTRTAARALNARQEQFFLEHGLGTVLLRPAARLVRPFAWVGHLPFAHALVRLMRPHVLVELGTHTGNSFCGFCQAVTADALDMRCYAVDTWGGDAQAGYYGDTVYADLAPFVEAAYGGFATLMRTTFDEALDRFEDGRVDLLHIDGLHSYEAVRHDFEAWERKLSPRGVVLFHDTRVFDREFGVHRVWAELRERHPSFEFLHSHGLGVLLVGSDVAPAVRAFVELAAEDPGPLQAAFERAALAGLPNEAIAYQRRFGSVPYSEAANLDCELFLDRGRGFNESEKLIYALGLEQGRGVVRYDLDRFSDGLSRVRFDPGNGAIALESVAARWQDGEGSWHDLERTGSSAVSADANVLLFGDDPWVEYALPPSPVHMLEIEVRVGAMGMALVALLVERVKTITGLQDELGSSKATIDNLQDELGSSKATIDSLQDELGSSKATIDSLQDELGSSKATIDSLQDELGSSKATIDSLQDELGSSKATIDSLQDELAAHRMVIDRLKNEVAAHQEAEKKLWQDVAEKDRDLAVLRQAVSRPLYRALAGVKLLLDIPSNKPKSK